MLRIATCLALTTALTACTGDDGGGGSGSPNPDLRVSTRFVVTSIEGIGTSPLDPLRDQTIDFDLVWPHASIDYPSDEQVGCASRLFGFDMAERTAYGSSAALVQAELLDRLDGWAVWPRLCDPPVGPSRVSLSALNADLVVRIVCDGFPDSAQKRDSERLPVLTTFTATECKAEIEDLRNQRTLTNDSVSIRIETGPAQLP